MTAGNNVILSAIQVDIARHPAQALPGAMGQFMLRRNRGATRRCLFGPPDPGVTRNLLNQIIAKDNAYMRQRYNFDVLTERFIGPSEGISDTTSVNDETVVASKTTTTVVIATAGVADNDVDVDSTNNCDINLQRQRIEHDVASEPETTFTISTESTAASLSEGFSLNSDSQSETDDTTICTNATAAVVLDNIEVPLLKGDTCANPSEAKRSRSNKYHSEIIYVDHTAQMVNGGDGNATNTPYQKTITDYFKKMK